MATSKKQPEPEPVVPEDMTKEELHEQFGVSKSQTKSEMLEEVQQKAGVDPETGVQLTDPMDPAVRRAMEYKGLL